MPARTSLLPPFPDHLRTHALLVIDYDLIKAGDIAEADRLWEAATSIGFWYLKNHGAEQHVNDMYELGVATMTLPLEEKMKFEQGDDGQSFGYKKLGANAVDSTGRLDSAEFLNISKDDALAFPKAVHRTYPGPTAAAMPTVVRPFIRLSLDIINTIIRVFNDRLGLPEGTLEGLHSDEELSCSETRIIKAPPLPGEALADKPTLGAHTDFGTLSFLHNWLGGLQVMPPGTTEWLYVKECILPSFAMLAMSLFTYDSHLIQPVPEYAICNVGDALAIFSGGNLQSNIHRVIPSPGAQANHERWSIVFFSRPSNSIVLRALEEESPLIANAVQAHSNKSRFDTGQTAAEWFLRRVKNHRINNRKGPETWATTRGTEHNPTA